MREATTDGEQEDLPLWSDTMDMVDELTGIYSTQADLHQIQGIDAAQQAMLQACEATAAETKRSIQGEMHQTCHRWCCCHGADRRHSRKLARVRRKDAGR